MGNCNGILSISWRVRSLLVFIQTTRQQLLQVFRLILERGCILMVRHLHTFTTFLEMPLPLVLLAASGS